MPNDRALSPVACTTYLYKHPCVYILVSVRVPPATCMPTLLYAAVCSFTVLKHASERLYGEVVAAGVGSACVLQCVGTRWVQRDQARDVSKLPYLHVPERQCALARTVFSCLQVDCVQDSCTPGWPCDLQACGTHACAYC